MFKFGIPAGARKIATFTDGWMLFERAPTQTSSFLWVQFKLQLPEDTRKRNGVKRTFWLTWNPLVGRLANSGDAHALRQRHPDLYEQVVLELKMTYTLAWLTEVDGRDQTEINAEIGRLNAQRQLKAAKEEALKRNSGVAL
jgi:hypothetical protein